MEQRRSTITPIGHSVTGLAIGFVSLSTFFSTKKRGWHLVFFILIASIPDIPLPNWGHDLYRFSHSLLVNLMLFFLVLLLFNKVLQRIYSPIRIGTISIFFGIAWFSHLLLDSLYNHRLGVIIGWPFTETTLNLPIPWLSVQHSPFFPITIENLRIWGIELITFSPLVLLAIVVNFIRHKLDLVEEKKGVK